MSALTYLFFGNSRSRKKNLSNLKKQKMMSL